MKGSGQGKVEQLNSKNQWLAVSENPVKSVEQRISGIGLVSGNWQLVRIKVPKGLTYGDLISLTPSLNAILFHPHYPFYPLGPLGPVKMLSFVLMIFAASCDILRF